MVAWLFQQPVDIFAPTDDGNPFPVSKFTRWDAKRSPRPYHQLRPTHLGSDNSNHQYGPTQLLNSRQRWPCTGPFPRPFISNSRLVLVSDHPSRHLYSSLRRMGHKPQPRSVQRRGGEAGYTLPTSEKFQIQARAPGRKFNLQVFLDEIVTQGEAKGARFLLGGIMAAM